MSNTKWCSIYFYIQRIHQHCNSTPSVLAAFNRDFHLLPFDFYVPSLCSDTSHLQGATMNLFMHFSLTSPHKQESSPKECHIRYVGTPYPHSASPPAQQVAIYSAAKSKAARQSPTIVLSRPEHEIRAVVGESLLHQKN